MRLFSPVRVITLGNKLKERFASRRFTLLFHQINDEGKWVFLNGPTHTLCYCHVCPPLCGSFGFGFPICVSPGAPSILFCMSLLNSEQLPYLPALILANRVEGRMLK